jgi:DNA-binding SARP family transcriptional activator
MTILHIKLLGGFHVRDVAAAADVKVTPNLQHLLAYLLLFRHRAYARDVLMELFWGDHDEAHARACLNTALWRLRGLLEPPGRVEKGHFLVTTAAGEVSFNAGGGCLIDVAEFERLVAPPLRRAAPALRAADAAQLEAGLALYGGDLLEGVYADWALRERERYREMYLTALYHLMQYNAAQSNFDDALRCGRLILLSDPLREHIHRDLMRLYAAGGQRSQAIQQYHACAEVLRAELGLAPMRETQLLYQQLLLDGDDGRAAAGPAADNVTQAVQELFTLFGAIQQQFNHVLQLLDHARR